MGANEFTLQEENCSNTAFEAGTLFIYICWQAIAAITASIHFLNSKGVKSAALHRQICKVYAETLMSDGRMMIEDLES